MTTDNDGPDCPTCDKPVRYVVDGLTRTDRRAYP